MNEDVVLPWWCVRENGVFGCHVTGRLACRVLPSLCRWLTFLSRASEVTHCSISEMFHVQTWPRTGLICQTGRGKKEFHQE